MDTLIWNWNIFIEDTDVILHVQAKYEKHWWYIITDTNISVMLKKRYAI